MEYKAIRVEQPLQCGEREREREGVDGAVVWMADVLSVHYVTIRQLNAYMYTGDSWPVNSRNIDVGIVFIKICNRYR